ncbi:MAG: nuclease domain-containing protein [Paraburkholderia sp.]|uniref:nuclease domain-containing protein n=1 Tax=Paraburkholderia sp. TaxID=1926495 RepID=UPI003C608989
MTARLIGFPKELTYRNQKIRDSARDEDCLVRLPGACLFDPRATIWSHYRGGAGGKAGALKADDLAGAYACTACDAVYDGQRPPPAGMTYADVVLAWHEGHIRSIVRLHAKGVLK